MNTDELDPRLKQALRELPVPPPSASFADRALRAGRAPVAAYRWRASLAVAASLLVAVGVARWPSAENAAPADRTPVALVAAGKVEPVRLVFRSPRALSGVTVELSLPTGVELAAYEGRRTLQWQVDLQAGANSLELPVVLREGEGGLLTASLTRGADRREFSLRVKARDDHVFEAPATRSASLVPPVEEMSHA